MRRSVFSAPRLWDSCFDGLCNCPLNFAVAHEGHQMDCTETSINAMNTDIQAMDDGEAKTTAIERNGNGRRHDGQEGHEGL